MTWVCFSLISMSSTHLYTNERRTTDGLMGTKDRGGMEGSVMEVSAGADLGCRD